MTLLTKWSFKNKAAITIIALMTLLVGVLSYFNLPMELMPEADNPQVTVSVLGQGMDAKTMEKQVTEPIEQAVQGVKGKSGIFSTTGTGYTQININFEVNADMKAAKQEVQEAVNQIRLPQGVSQPYVLQLNTSMIPVAQIFVSFDDGLTDANLEKAQQEIVPGLQNIDGVSNVALYGLAQPQVVITPDIEKLAQFNIPAQTIMGVLQGKNISSALGEKIIEGETASIVVESSIDDLDTLKRLPVVPGVALQDVAAVEVNKNHEAVARVGGKEVLFMMVFKEGSANIASVGTDVQKAVDDLNESITNANMGIFLSTSDFVVHSVNSMIREVLLGALFATIVILLFLRNIRATFITIVSIPLSLGITLYLLDLSGVTLNILTLGGVAVAVGRLVDDSIVVIENIYRRRSVDGEFTVELIIDATKEVARAITSSTITTVAVFLPIGLLRGGLQAFLQPFALTVTYSLLASLIVSLTVVPLMSKGLLKNAKFPEHKHPRRFMRILEWNLKHKWVTLTVAAVLFVSSIGGYFVMPKGAISAENAQFISINLSYPAHTPVETVLEKGSELEQYLLDQPEAKHVLLQQGNSADAAQWGSVVSETLVTLMVAMNEDADGQDFMDRVKAKQSEFKGAAMTVDQASMMPSSGTTVYIDITGDDFEQISQVTGEVIAKVEALDGVEKVSNNLEEKKTTYSIQVDPETANAQDVAMQLGMMLNPMPIGYMEVDGYQATVMLQPLVNPTDAADIEQLQYMTSSGPVLVSSIAKIEKQEQFSTIYHKDGKSYARVSAQVDPNKLSVIGMEITAATDEIEHPEGIKLHVGGASAEQAGDFGDLFMTMLVSIGLVFIIMVVTFKTIRAPLAILFSLPLAAIGAVAGLMISGINPDFTAAFGALMLIGVVVTNAIVLIDRVKHNEETMSIRESLIEAAATRMRPIFMTAIATICAMLPLIFADAEMGSIVSPSLAIVVIGGLLVATALTLIVVPIIYELLHFRKSRKQRAAH